jgi:hypothetical protein
MMHGQRNTKVDVQFCSEQLVRHNFTPTVTIRRIWIAEFAIFLFFLFIYFYAANAVFMSTPFLH